MDQRRIEDARNRLQAVVSALGRDDIAVGEVSVEDGVVEFVLTRGHFSQPGQITLDLLADRERALAQLISVVRRLSRAIEEEHIAQAARPAE